MKNPKLSHLVWIVWKKFLDFYLTSNELKSVSKELTGSIKTLHDLTWVHLSSICFFFTCWGFKLTSQALTCSFNHSSLIFPNIDTFWLYILSSIQTNKQHYKIKSSILLSLLMIILYEMYLIIYIKYTFIFAKWTLLPFI